MWYSPSLLAHSLSHSRCIGAIRPSRPTVINSHYFPSSVLRLLSAPSRSLAIREGSFGLRRLTSLSEPRLINWAPHSPSQQAAIYQFGVMYGVGGKVKEARQKEGVSGTLCWGHLFSPWTGWGDILFEVNWIKHGGQSVSRGRPPQQEYLNTNASVSWRTHRNNSSPHSITESLSTAQAVPRSLEVTPTSNIINTATRGRLNYLFSSQGDSKPPLKCHEDPVPQHNSNSTMTASGHSNALWQLCCAASWSWYLAPSEPSVQIRVTYVGP